MLVNVEGFWRPLMEMLARGVREGFIREEATKLIYLASNVQEAVEYLHRMETGGRAEI